MSKILNVIESLSCAVHTVSIIGLEPARPGYTLWFGLVRTVHPGLVPRPGRLKTNHQLSILYNKNVSRKRNTLYQSAVGGDLCPLHVRDPGQAADRALLHHAQQRDGWAGGPNHGGHREQSSQQTSGEVFTAFSLLEAPTSAFAFKIQK